jgi:hypothetical protein
MKILITAKYVSGSAYEGGSSRFMRCLADTLRGMGHFVTALADPGPVAGDYWDLIICSHHEQFAAIRDNPARKLYVSHGLIPDENFPLGADRYISISEEVRRHNLKLSGIDSEVIGQPIMIRPRTRPADEVRRILVIRGHAPDPDPFAFLAGEYDLRISDPGTPIEDQIEWADLVIALGRGALEAMAQGRPVIVADCRHYIGAYGDGYVQWENVREMAKCNFSGRRYWVPLTHEWIQAQVDKYNPIDSMILHKYAAHNHDARKIAARYLQDGPGKAAPRRDADRLKISFGVMVNDMLRLDMVLRQSELQGKMHFIQNPESATKGLNKLLDVIEGDGNDIAILTHQDMYYRQGWIDIVRDQLSRLPESWVVAGIIGKDMDGLICGKFHDMRIPQHFNTSHVHDFPHPACCFDECCIIVNLEKKFRFDETMAGFDLYGTLCVLQAWASGGTAWVIDAFAEHYCTRPFSWVPDDLFIKNFKWLYDRFHEVSRLDSTAIGLSREDLNFATSAA